MQSNLTRKPTPNIPQIFTQLYNIKTKDFGDPSKDSEGIQKTLLVLFHMPTKRATQGNFPAVTF